MKYSVLQQQKHNTPDSKTISRGILEIKTKMDNGFAYSCIFHHHPM